MLKEMSELVVASPFRYRLRAAVTHFGSHGNGHYVCYRPHATIVTELVENEDKKNQPSPEESSNEQPREPSEESMKDPTNEPLNESTDQPTSETLEEQWWRFSDDTVYAVDGGQAHQANVFMLFYERLDEPITTHVPDAEFIPTTIAFAEDAPLPPEILQNDTGDVSDTEAASKVPLPDDDDLLDLISPEESKGPSTSIEKITTLVTAPSLPAPLQDDQDTQRQSSSQDTETEMSEAESEDAPSTQVTSDDEMEPSHPPTPKPIMRVPPPAMRTAGNAGARGQGSRQSLPMVSAT
jgi:ubiquitin carboxyl-terminal hydrolase 1